MKPFKYIKYIMYVLLPLLTGCASILGSTAETVVLDSNEPATFVEVYNSDDDLLEQGPTPMVINLKKGKGYFLREHYKIKVYTKDGFSWEHEIYPNIYIVYFFSLVIPGGIIGMLTVDPYTGSMWTFYQDRITVDEAQ